MTATQVRSRPRVFQVTWGIVIAILIPVTTCGCSLWPSRQLEQCQQESSQALSRYQIEAQRAQRLEDQNRKLSAQIADLEKRLATLHDSGYAASLASSRAATDAPVAPFPSTTPSTAALPASPLASDSQSPDAAPAAPSSTWRSVPKRAF